MSTAGPFHLFGSGGGPGGSAGGGGPGAGGDGAADGRRGRGASVSERISLEKLFDQPPPYSPEAEMALLGAMMLDPQVIHEVITIVKTGEAFFNEAHAAIFEAIVRTYDQKQSGDPVLIIEYLRSKGQFEDIGGVDYLEKLMRETPGPAAAVHFARIVADKARLRRLIRAGGQIVYEAYNAGSLGDDGAKQIVDKAEALVFEIAQQEETSDAQSLSVLVEQEYQRILALQGKGISGVATGFHDLDELTSGLQKGEMIIIAARPSMGKCLSAESELVLEDGSIATIEELYRRRSGRIPTLRDDLRLASAAPSDFIDDGRKPVFEVATRLGRRVRTTLSHPFLTINGWTPLAELSVGDHVAVPRTLPIFGCGEMRPCEVKLLAYLIGDGGLTGTVPRFTNRDARIAADFAEAVEAFGGLRLTVSSTRKREAPSWRVIADQAEVGPERRRLGAALRAEMARSGRTGRMIAAAAGVSPSLVTQWCAGDVAPDPAVFERVCAVLDVRADDLAPGGLERMRRTGANRLTAWLESLGLMGGSAQVKHVPAPVFSLKRDLVALFLNRLFSTDGWATVLASGQCQLGYASVSERLARQVQHLLLRFGVIASLRQRWVKYKDSRRPSWQLDIADAESIRTFIRDIGIFGKEAALDRVEAALADRGRRTNRDLIPAGVWRRIAAAKGAMPWRELAQRIDAADNLHVDKRGISRGRLARIAEALDDQVLRDLASSDIYWDRVVSIEPLGERQVYDLTIPQTHNFVAEDVCVHNTALCLNLAEQIALGGAPNERRPENARPTPVAFFSLEMSKSAIAQRLLSARSGYSSHDMRSGRLREEDYDRICEAMYELSEAKVYVDDTPGLSVLGLRTRARRMVAQYGVEIIMIDYLQLMSAPQAARESRQVEVSAISRGIKALARELNVPVICLSQLNRGPESRGDNRPRMSDLRESGSIEQDADVVMLLHREAYYHVGDKDWELENEDKLNVAELIIAKQRNGPTDVVKLTWDQRLTRFRNFAPHAGGTGLSPGYAAAGPAKGGFAPAVQDPFRVEVVPFSPGRKTGPIANHRDGGGPDREDPPFDDAGDVGLPI